MELLLRSMVMQLVLPKNEFLNSITIKVRGNIFCDLAPVQGVTDREGGRLSARFRATSAVAQMRFRHHQRPQQIGVRHGSHLHPPGLGVAIAETHLSVAVGDDVVLADDAR